MAHRGSSSANQRVSARVSARWRAGSRAIDGRRGFSGTAGGRSEGVTSTLSAAPVGRRDRLASGVPSPPAARGALWKHLALLAVVVVGLVWVIDSGVVGNADEGAMLAQARQLEVHQRWGTPYWAQSFDPDGRWFPVELSERAGDLWFPYVKRPVYPRLVSALLETGGLRLVLVAHAFGTVATALAASLLARKLSSRLAIPTLWAVGVGSPLLFDSYQVIAHSLGTAAMTWAALAAVTAIGARRVTGSVAALAAVAACVALGTSLRTEAALYSVALAVGLVVAWGGSRRMRAFAGAGAVVVGAAVGYLGSAWWAARIMGAGAAPFVVRDREGWLAGRLGGAWNSLLSPQILGSPIGAVTVVIAAVSCIWLAATLRRHPGESGLIGVLGVIAAVAAIVRLFAPMGPVPGLVMAAPLLVGGLVLCRGWAWDHPVARLAVVAGVIHACAVLATQYGIGGAGEWGGRFFHVAVPLLVPLAIAGWWGAVGPLGSDLRRRLVACGAVVFLAGTILSVGAQVAIRTPTRTLVDGLDAAVAAARRAEPSAQPVVVATHHIVGRMWWEHSLDVDTLVLSDSGRLAEALAALEGSEEGGRPVVLLTGDALAPKVRALSDEGWRVRRIERLPSITGATYLLTRP